MSHSEHCIRKTRLPGIYTCWNWYINIDLLELYSLYTLFSYEIWPYIHFSDQSCCNCCVYVITSTMVYNVQEKTGDQIVRIDNQGPMVGVW